MNFKHQREVRFPSKELSKLLTRNNKATSLFHSEHSDQLMNLNSNRQFSKKFSNFIDAQPNKQLDDLMMKNKNLNIEQRLRSNFLCNGNNLNNLEIQNEILIDKNVQEKPSSNKQTQYSASFNENSEIPPNPIQNYLSLCNTEKLFQKKKTKDSSQQLKRSTEFNKSQNTFQQSEKRYVYSMANQDKGKHLRLKNLEVLLGAQQNSNELISQQKIEKIIIIFIRISNNRVNIQSNKDLKKGQSKEYKVIKFEKTEKTKEDSFDFLIEKPNFNKFKKKQPIRTFDMIYNMKQLIKLQIKREQQIQEKLNDPTFQLEIIRRKNQISLLMSNSKSIQQMRKVQSQTEANFNNQETQLEGLIQKFSIDIKN